jgi:hypothetical protein
MSTNPNSQYGRSLTQPCYNGSLSTGDQLSQCVGGIQAPGLIYLRNATETTTTALNVSTVNQALTCSVNGKNFAYLSSVQRDPGLDFQASTLAIETKCSMSSRTCDLHEEQVCNMPSGCSLGPIQLNQAMKYNCSGTLYGDLDVSSGSPFNDTTHGSMATGAISNIDFFIQLFEKTNFTGPIGRAGYRGAPNPFYFTVGAQVTASDTLVRDPEIVASNLQFNSAFLMSCSATVYELEYVSSNGSVIRGNYTKAPNSTLTDSLSWALIYQKAILQNSMELELISSAIQSNTSQQLADSFAESFSRTGVSMLVGATQPSTNIAEQRRQTKLVTRLPKAPFFTLIILNLLYAVVGILLTTMALLSQPRLTRNVQARLTTAGLVAALLEPNGGPPSKKNNSGVESAFAEHHNTEKSLNDRVMIIDTGSNSIFETVACDGLGEKHADVPHQDPRQRPASVVATQQPLRNGSGPLGELRDDDG